MSASRATLLLMTVLAIGACNGNTPGSVPGEDTAGARGSTVRAAGIPMAEPLPATALPDVTGRDRPLRLHADEATVINFWATWCVPCLEEIPVLVALEQAWRDDNVRVVGIALASGTPEDVRQFAERHAMGYDLRLADMGWAGRTFGVLGLPVTLITDRDGVLRHRLIGPQTLQQFETALRDVLDAATRGGES